MSEYVVRPIPVEEAEALREALLDRPGFPGDNRPEALLLGGHRDDRLVGIGSIAPRVPAGFATPAASPWELYGVAVEHGHRGLGLGQMLLERLLEHAAVNGADLVWCRVPARVYGFFAHYGLQRMGEPLPLDDGPHYDLAAALQPPDRSWRLDDDEESEAAPPG